MSKKYVFFVDNECNIISDEKIYYHEELAEKLLDENEKLKRRYYESGIDNKTLFLLIGEKYFAGCNTDRYREICYISPVLDKRREILVYYYEEGYKLIDLVKEYGEELEKLLHKNKQKDIEER